MLLIPDNLYNNVYHALRKNSFVAYITKSVQISISFPGPRRRRAKSGFSKILQITLPFFWTSNYIQHAFTGEIFVLFVIIAFLRIFWKSFLQLVSRSISRICCMFAKVRKQTRADMSWEKSIILFNLYCAANIRWYYLVGKICMFL